MMFGGRVAEELTFGAENVTTGAANDIQQATDLARRMVTEWGMSEKLGRLRYSDNEEEIFIGRSITRAHNVSEETARMIDTEVRSFIEEAEQRARLVLTEHSDDLHHVAQALLEYETLSGNEVQRIMRGETIDRDEHQDHTGPNDGTQPSIPVDGPPAERPTRKPSGGSVPGLQPGH
jgi:cell division protease FtsH